MIDNGKPRAGSRAARWGIVALLVAFACLAATYSVVTPLFEASDELWHYPLVRHLADGGGLPVQDPANPGPWLQEGSQPPLYYWLAALVSKLAPAGDPFELLPRNPHADIGRVRADGNVNMVIHTAAEAFVYRGQALAIHLVRGLSVLLGTLTVLFTYLIGAELWPRRPGLALAAAAAVAFTPMFLFISGSVNNDNLVVTLATASLWLLLRLLRRPPAPVPWLLLGALIGLAALTKVSALGLLGLAALALAWLSWRRRDWKLFLWGGTCAAGMAALVAGWWYVRNWRLYGDPLGFNMMVAIAGPRAVRPTLLELLDEWQGFIRVYWGVFGGMNVVAPEWFYSLFDVLALLGVGGLAVAAARRLVKAGGGSRTPSPERSGGPSPERSGGPSPEPSGGPSPEPSGGPSPERSGGPSPEPSGGAPTDWDGAFRLFLVAVWPLLVMAGLVRWTMLTMASQGRLMFPAIASLSYLLVLGWSAWVPESARRDAYCVLRDVAHSSTRRSRRGYVLRITHYVLRLVPVALMAGVALWVPFGAIAPAYAPPPLLTAAEEAAIPQRLDVAVGDQMELLGYRLDKAEARPGDELAVTLYWRARAPMDTNYSVYIHLLDQNECVIAQRDVYPGRGLFPTTQWRAGDALADTYILRVPANTFQPNRLQIEAGLYSLGNAPLAVRDREGRELGRGIRFGEVQVRAEPVDGIANPIAANLGNEVTVLGYDLDRTALRPGETLRLALWCRALAPLAADYTPFAHVLAPDGTLWAGKAGWPEGTAPSGGWAQGQTISFSLDLVLRPDAPPGDYYVDAGFYRAGSARKLNLLDRWGHVLDSRVVLTRIRVAPAEATQVEPQTVFPPIQHPLDIGLGNVARLKGFSLGQESLNPNEPLRLTLYWQAGNTAPAAAYTVFVHLLDGNGQIVAQHDSPPAYGQWPTTSWTGGQAIVDEHSLPFKNTMYSGQVLVEVGLYDATTMQRLPTSQGDDKVILPIRIDVRP